MGVGVDRVGNTMGGPTGVTDTGHGAFRCLFGHRIFEVGDSTGLLDHVDGIATVEGDPC